MKTPPIDALRRLGNKKYYLLKWYFHFNYHIRDLLNGNKPYLLVYQMGKVGSSTIAKSLLKYRKDYRICQIHTLRKRVLKDEESFFVDNFDFLKTIDEYILIGQYLSKRIKNKSGKTKYKIVTLIRDPIARNISAFFNNLERRIMLQHPVNGNDVGISHNVEELMERFWNDFNQHDVPLIWFNTELKRAFGIDVYSREFPKSKGFDTYHGETADVLLIRLENLRDCAGEAFRQFLGIPDFTLTDVNVGHDKEYSEAYERFLSSVTVPPWYLEMMYNSQYVRHFYTRDEIQGFVDRWGVSASGSKALPMPAPPDTEQMKRAKRTLTFKEALIVIFGDDTYNGCVDQCDSEIVLGWARNCRFPNERLSVELVMDGELLDTVKADLYREDLLEAGIGDGKHAFYYVIPPALKDGRSHAIKARIAGTDRLLINGVRTVRF
ncbi:MAG: hypothetical protein HY788_12405 [Deltaproteobacteria bacterium]|nr:hypothetical protein [Deltaproteobacteria bacterium]